MVLYAKIDADGYIDGFSDKVSEIFDTDFEIDEDNIFELSACSGKCFKIENGVAVKRRDITEYITAHREKADKLKEITALKQQLFESDYKAIKYSEGFYTEEEYQPIRQERADIRARINQLEDEIK